MTRILFIIFIMLIPYHSVLPHSGGLDSSGGHTNSSTGNYHKHQSYSKKSGTASKWRVLIIPGLILYMIGFFWLLHPTFHEWLNSLLKDIFRQN